MPAPITVWAVELGPATPVEEVRGTLALEADALVFSSRDREREERRYRLADVVKARRLRGSPVLLVVRDTPEGPKRTAFYFVQPPSLERHDEPARSTFGAIRRGTSRKVRRQNVTYLGLWNREKKQLLRAWEQELRAASTAARGAVR